MYIVAEMATTATRRDVGAAAARVAMAIGALQTQMRAVDGEIRVQIVVEACQRPVVAVVAGTAIIAKSALMGIGFLVAVDTLGRCIAKAITGVAGATGDRGVQPCQRK